MSGASRSRGFVRLVAVTAFLGAACGAQAAPGIADPLSFFAGRTVSESIVKVMMKKPARSRSVGRGRLLPDHSLDLVQHVEEDGKAPHDRRWRIRQVGPGRFVGTMSEAVGPVVVEESGSGYRFRFKLKGNLSVDEMLTPLAGGTAARIAITVRKFGISVARSDGTIRKLD